MKAKSTLREKSFVPGTSRKREAAITLRLEMSMDETSRLAMGARLAKMRRAAGLKQKEIADYCGVEVRTYQFWQQGKSPPTGDALPKLSQLLRSRGLDYATESYIINGAATPTPALSDALEPAWVNRIERKLDEILERLGPATEEETPPADDHPLPEDDDALEPKEPSESPDEEAPDEPSTGEEEADSGGA